MSASTTSPLYYSNEESILHYMSQTKKKDNINLDCYVMSKCPVCENIVTGVEYDHADILCPECSTVLMGTVPYVGLEPVDYPWGLNL